LNAAIGPVSGKGSGEQTLLSTLLDTFTAGDIVLGDAYFGTYFLLAELMVYQNPKIKYMLIMVAIFFIITKLFTAVIILKDDPSNFLVLKLSPSLDSQLSLSLVDEKKYIILFSDENGFVGEKLYYLVTSYLWWLIPVFAVLFIVVTSRKNTNN